MKEEDKNEEVSDFWWVPLIALLIIVVFFFANFVMLSSETRYVVVDSEIIDIKTIVDKDGKIDHLRIYFANGEIYKVRLTSSLGTNIVDLTVNSDIVLELESDYSRWWFWEDFEPTDDIYTINKIIKIP